MSYVFLKILFYIITLVCKTGKFSCNVNSVYVKLIGEIFMFTVNLFVNNLKTLQQASMQLVTCKYHVCPVGGAVEPLSL